MKLWVDADAAPRDVKDVCFRASERLSLETVLVANQRIILPVGYRYLSAVRVDGGPDVADIYIADHADKGDVAVTAGISLAAGLVPQKIGRGAGRGRGEISGGAVSLKKKKKKERM